jgi:pilus assembly protein CpaE
MGIISATNETTYTLREQIHSTGLAEVRLELEEYCTSRGDRPTRRLLESKLDVVIVDIGPGAPGIQCLNLLRSVLPGAWLFVTSDNQDPQFIIDTMRAGAREFLPKPITSRSLSEALQRVRDEKAKETHSGPSGKMFWIAAAKPGSGATTIAINLAAAIGSAGDAKALLIDLARPVGDVAAFLNLKPDFNLADAIGASSRLDSALLDSYTVESNGLAVLTGVDQFNPANAPAADEISRVLEVAGNSYPYSFFDLPLSSGPDVLKIATEVSSGILLVVTPELPSLWRANRVMGYFKQAGADQKVKIVVNRSRRVDEIRDTEIQEAIHHPVFWKLPGDEAACVEAMHSGRAIIAVEHSDIARSYREMAQQLTGAAPQEKRRRLMKLFS